MQGLLMTTDREFSHPDFGHRARVELLGREVRLIFVASTEGKAASLADAIVAQLKNGVISITMIGKPISFTEDTDA